MADSKTEVFGLDLDAKGFVEGATLATSSIEGLGEAMLALAPELAIITVAVAALKVSFDAAFETEKIEKANALFDTMAKNVGIVSDKLRDDLVKSVDGLATASDTIQAANQAMLSLGQNAEKLPQIMDLARTLTQKFGGDMIERFDQLTHAIASGSSRMLKANGIFIDTNKALKDFAKSLGVSVDALTEAGKQQAILNATLDYGNQRLQGTKNTSDTLSESWTRLKVAFSEFFEVFNSIIDRAPAFIAAFQSITEVLHGAATALEEKFGKGAKQAEASIALLKTSLVSLQEELANLEKSAGDDKTPAWVKSVFGGSDVDSRIAKVKAQIEATQKEISKAEDKATDDKEKRLEKETADVKNANANQLVDYKKAEQERLKFEEEILQMQIKNNQTSIQLATSKEQLDQLQFQRRLLLETQFTTQVKKVESDYDNGKITSTKMRDQKLEQLQKQYTNDVLKLRKQEKKEYDQMLQNQLDEATTVFGGISAAAQKSSHDAQVALLNFGATGVMVMDTIKTRGTQAFEDFGKAIVDHSQSASQIMRGFFLNALADMAESQGKLFLAAGLFGNSAELAAGAALLVLSGVLRAEAGGGGSSIGGGYSGGGYGSSSASDTAATAAPVAQAQEQKGVTVQIMGDFLSTDQTKRQLLQYVRDATDATDFKYVEIGQS